MKELCSATCCDANVVVRNFRCYTMDDVEHDHINTTNVFVFACISPGYFYIFFLSFFHSPFSIYTSIVHNGNHVNTGEQKRQTNEQSRMVRGIENKRVRDASSEKKRDKKGEGGCGNKNTKATLHTHKQMVSEYNFNDLRALHKTTTT